MGARIAEQRVHRRAVGEGADHRAVVLGTVIKRARGREACRRRQVLGDDIRMARNVIGPVAREGAGIDVVAAAGAAADQHGDGMDL